MYQKNTLILIKRVWCYNCNKNIIRSLKKYIKKNIWIKYREIKIKQLYINNKLSETYVSIFKNFYNEVIALRKRKRKIDTDVSYNLLFISITSDIDVI